MKTLLISSMVTLAAMVGLQAEETTTITNVHLCCKGCILGAEKAVGTAQGVTVSANQDAGTLTLTGPDKASLQRAANALVRAGYYGKSADSAVILKCDTGAQGKQVQSLDIEGVHLCCAKCAKAVERAVKSVPGVANQDAMKGVKKFTVSGDFNDKAVFEALEKEGLAGKVAQVPESAPANAPIKVPAGTTER